MCSRLCVLSQTEILLAFIFIFNLFFGHSLILRRESFSLEEYPKFLSQPIEFEHSSAIFGPDPGTHNLNGIPLLAKPYPRACKKLNAVPPGTILIAGRGNCNFYDKARFAQEAGAIGLVVGNNQQSEAALVRMDWADDDHAHLPEITIPCVFVMKRSFQQLKRAVNTALRLGVGLNLTIQGPSWYDQGYQPKDAKEDG